jgi:hypothetical protein
MLVYLWQTMVKGNETISCCIVVPHLNINTSTTSSMKEYINSTKQAHIDEDCSILIERFHMIASNNLRVPVNVGVAMQLLSEDPRENDVIWNGKRIHLRPRVDIKSMDACMYPWYDAHTIQFSPNDDSLKNIP